MAKVLVFEGAGWSDADSSRATIGNCRIRTAFHLDDGRAVYLELVCGQRGKHACSYVYQWEYTGFISHAHYITDEQPNGHQVPRSALPASIEYSLPAILRLVNSLGASFDAVEVAPDYSGYRVFGDHNRYNYGDEFVIDPELCARRAALVQAMQERHKRLFGVKYDNTSYYVEGGRLVMRLCVSDKALQAAGIRERVHVLEPFSLADFASRYANE